MKKILAVVLSALMILSLAACGESSASTTAAATTAATEAATTTAPIGADVTTVQSGKLIMATNASFPPYEYIDDDGSTIIGIDAEIAQLIADEMGLELVIKDMEFTSIITAVQTGKVDMGMAGMTVTEDRLKNVNFSTSYSKGVQSVIVLEDSDIASIDDLAGKKIGVQEGTTGCIYCEDDFGADNVTAYLNAPTAVQALLKGSVDCVVIDNNPATVLVSENEGLKLLDTAYTEEDYAIALAKESEGLLAKINEILEAKIADGTVQTIVDKYISAE